jgi:hypothetical protein
MRIVPFVAIAALAFPTTAHAIPAFARQTGMPCSACHTQQFPTLNSFGRLFKLNGFTLIGTQPKIEGNILSIPAILNASLFVKMRVVKTNGAEAAGEHTSNSGRLDLPDEFVLLFAGRMSEHIGFMVETQLPTRQDAALAAFKIPFSYDVHGLRASVIPFSTEDLGAPFGFELLNTGAVNNIRYMEHADAFSAQQYIGTATPASGAAFVLGNQHFFANVTSWAPVHLATADEEASPLPSAGYARFAWTPSVHGWDVGAGVQQWFGSTAVATGDGPDRTVTTATRAVAIDGQLQGTVWSHPLSIFVSAARSDGSPIGGTPNLFNDGTRDRTAMAIGGQLGIVPERGSLLLAYRTGDNGAPTDHVDRAVTVGGLLHLHQNVQLQVNYTMRSGNAFQVMPRDGNRMLTLMLAAGM